MMLRRNPLAAAMAGSLRTRFQVRFASSDASKTLKKTLVYDEHVKVGGVMVRLQNPCMGNSQPDS